MEGYKLKAQKVLDQYLYYKKRRRPVNTWDKLVRNNILDCR